MTDVMVDGEGAIATSAEAEAIGDELEQAAVSGPTRSAALEQPAEYDEDEDGSGEPLEYGIWDGHGLHDYVAVVRRRQAAPLRKDQWLVIDSDRDDVDVRLEYEDSEAPDFVEVRYAYRKTNLIRHSSPAAEGYSSDRGYADDLPYDWQFTESGGGELSVAVEDDQRRYKMDPGAAGQVQARFPKDGTYPIIANALLGGAYEDEAVIPGIFDVPLRFQVWAKGRGTVGCMMRTNVGGAFNSDPVLTIDDGEWQLHRYDWRPDPASTRYEFYMYLIASVAGEPLWWRNAQLYMLIPDGTELSAWYPYQPEGAGHAIKTYDLPFPATIWQARNSARKFHKSFARGRGRGTITARGILHDARGREVPVSRIRGGWWASIVNDPRCAEPLYVSSIECSPYELEAELGIGGETPPWSARTPLYERRTFGRYEAWRGFRPLGRHR